MDEMTRVLIQEARRYQQGSLWQPYVEKRIIDRLIEALEASDVRAPSRSQEAASPGLQAESGWTDRPRPDGLPCGSGNHLLARTYVCDQQAGHDGAHGQRLGTTVAVFWPRYSANPEDE